LRNPQELAFDDFGNLFTVDNNSDSGDRARFVQIVEGGDSGWRIGYQYETQMHDLKVVRQGNRGPWNYEKLWHPYHEGQPAYIVPPIVNFADGPSGFTHYPGIGLPEKYKGHFFLCDFRGSAGGSGVWSFTTKPKGASFEMVNPQHFVWNLLATDCDFGPDCGFYISDWTNGWNKPGKGRLYKVTDPEEQRKDAVREVKEILAKGFGQLKRDELIKLLSHPHQQVRQEAQFALAAKGKEAIEPLANVAREGKNRLARIHAVWGLGMIGRHDVAAFEPLIALLKDGDAEIRAQAAKSLGGSQSLSVVNELIKLLDDPEPRVVFFAAQSIALGNDMAHVYVIPLEVDVDGSILITNKDGKETKIDSPEKIDRYMTELFKSYKQEEVETGDKKVVITIRVDRKTKYSELLRVMTAAREAGFEKAEMRIGDRNNDAKHFAQGIQTIARQAQRNADSDPYLRHALSRALAALAGKSLDGDLHLDPSPSVRMVALLAWRHSLEGRPENAKLKGGPLAEIFFADSDPKIVAEAARAIHDFKLPDALPKLAALTVKSNDATTLYRALNAHFLLGKTENAAALAAFAARPEAPELLRILALKMLGSWKSPPRRDFITGLTQNLPPRDQTVAANAMKAKLAGVFSGSTSVQKESASVAAKIGITEVGPFLFDLLSDAKAAAGARVEALSALDTLKDKRTQEAANAAIASDSPKLRNAGRAVLMKSKPKEVFVQLKDVLSKDNTIEKQGALALLAGFKSAEADDLVESWLDKLIKHEAPGELQLDILESAAERTGERVKRRLQSYEDSRPKGDEMAKYPETLQGGDPEHGRQIFLHNAAVSCQRCHKLDGEGGEVGPALNGIGGKQKRDYLLESIVLPSKQIAKGYDSVLITKTDGKSVAGVLKSEDKNEVKVMTAEGVLITINKEDVEARKATKSAMPEDIIQKLSKRDLRDVVEFLAGLKEEWKK
jgi:putative heme-binding domain-containing protein